jgi:16S rRNA (adenine1518-N6/adenine1519-N6)-dimethyltransferase
MGARKGGEKDGGSGRGNDGRAAFPRPRKRLGQHFLVDRNIIGKILAVARVSEGENVLEIGPGRGALTEALIRSGARVLAIEFDPALSGYLSERFAGSPGFEVITADALKVSFAELARERGCRFKAVSNLPYNISGPVLAKFIEERAAFNLLVLMLQKEVGERLAARPGTKAYGSLTVLWREYADVRREFDVAPGAFRPPPKVSSSVLSFRVLDAPRVAVGDEAFFRAVVRSAFGTRRKTLSNTLKGLGLERGAIGAALEAAGIDPKTRGEALDLDEFGALASELWRLKGP